MSLTEKASPIAPGITPPRHVAIVMDGNGRWARARHLPRTEGHRQGVGAVRRTVRFCAEQGVEVLTLFALSSENLQRPKVEIATLFELFLSVVDQELPQLEKAGVRLRFIGDIHAFSSRLQGYIHRAQERTRDNTGMTLVIAAGYGGRWDLTQAMQRLALQVQAQALRPEQITPQLMEEQLTTVGLADPDLFIRTGGEQRLSNFLLWQLAYTELFFSEVLWPDFDETELQRAFEFYAKRERRFGRITEAK
ncbi:polyprenyl diphosphate synthase [Thiorhodospira sibirica]|uniref:polyprenyl diphosphate synthase n=1 Tax=Thiorhodospira sibirica TaxID=154347 RepID=UPI00022C33D1|nr:polyprenyl diphosphate synthase [Thiorhodospira sibirica]